MTGMMDRFLYMERRAKGAISIFLILIFVATYMISGLLVDGGRYRIAQALAESALDSAEESVLSYYNQMLYDLYGLFAVDTNDITEEQIADVLKKYVEQTLQTTDISYNEYSTGLTDWLLEGDWRTEEDTPYFDDYDFTVDIEAGSSVTLANTDYVEDQIIDYMKYRAPVGLITESEGFINKLNAIVEVKDRLKATKDQITVTNGHKQLFTDSELLMRDINTFNEKVIAYCNNPCNLQPFVPDMVHGVSTAANGTISITRESYKDDQGNYNSDNCADLYELFGRFFDEELEEIGNYTAELKDEYDENGEQLYETAEELRIRQEADYEEAKDNFLSGLASMFVNAEILYNEANSLRDRIDSVNAGYQAYISELQAGLDQNPDNDQYRTVYEPEIELAKSNCGEILKNVDLILCSRQFTNDLVRLGNGSDWSAFETAVGDLMGHRLDGGSPISLKTALDAGEAGGWAGETAYRYFSAAQGDLRALMSQTAYFYKCHVMEVSVINGDSTIDRSPATDEQEEAKEPPADLREEHLVINYTGARTAAEGQSYQLESDVSTDNAEDIFNAGLSLTDTLLEALEGVRDNLYVNEYIMSTFPNVVREAYAEEENTTALQQKLQEYSATAAGVEYILIGNPDSGHNVNLVDAELLGMRTIFNSVAIFTDTAKRNQATAIATAISGPFAPIVTIVLLLAWAVAESALDVVQLKNNEEVELFKTGKDWQLSVEGAVEKCIDLAADRVAEEVDDLLSNIQSQIENKTNEAIYEVYNNVSGTADEIMNQAVAMAAGKVDQLTGTIAENSGNHEVCTTAMNEINSGFDTAVEQVQSRINGWSDEILGDAKDQAIKVINESVDTAFDKLGEETKNQINGLSQDLKDSIKGMIPIGEVSATGGPSAIRLDYEDYLRILLLMMNQRTKVERIQSLIQADMNHGVEQGAAMIFKMEDSAAAIWADMDCEIRYLFMTDAILPEGVKQHGRMSFTVHGARSY